MQRKNRRMKNLLLLLFVLLVLAIGGYWLWPRGGDMAPAQAANHDARALTAAEQAAFLPLVCGGASGAGGGYAHNCTSLPGYPTDDYGGAGTGIGITLTSVIMGHLTAATADEAFVSYQGSFEPHAENYGGGILFRADGKGGWILRKWIEGAAMDGCLSLTPQGRARFLCLSGYSGMGETDSALTVNTIPDARGTPVLSASDLRQTIDANANCNLRKSGQDVLLAITAVSRAGTGYTAQIAYVPAAVANAACQAKNFANAAVTRTSLALTWDGSAMHAASGFNFAPSR